MKGYNVFRAVLENNKKKKKRVSGEYFFCYKYNIAQNNKTITSSANNKDVDIGLAINPNFYEHGLPHCDFQLIPYQPMKSMKSYNAFKAILESSKTEVASSEYFFLYSSDKAITSSSAHKGIWSAMFPSLILK
jgi:hypothetical protein